MIEDQNTYLSKYSRNGVLHFCSRRQSPKFKASSNKGKGKEKEDEDSTSEEFDSTKTLKSSSEEENSYRSVDQHLK